MRKRWKVSEDFAHTVGFVWLFGGFAAAILAQSLWAGCSHGHCGMGNRYNSAPVLWAIGAWYGPVIVPALFAGLAYLVRYVWRERPRRVVVPITDDLRKVNNGR